MLALFDFLRPALMLGGLVLLLKALGVLTLGAMMRLGRPAGALVPLWTLAALATGYALTPVEPVYTTVIDLDDMVQGILRSLETMEAAPPPEERLAFDPLATLLHFVTKPPLGIWAALAGSAALNLVIVVRYR